MTSEVVFITSLAIIVYTYCGYFLLVNALSRLFGRRVGAVNITPAVSVIITARNEESDIAAKINNTLALDYPKHRLEVIVASDCSTDSTDEIVRTYAGQGVILCRSDARLGKTVAQNRAVDMSSGDILVFSDATTQWNSLAVRNIVRSFADPEVGCVAGQLVYAARPGAGISRGCSTYWNWEKQIRTCESRLGSLIGVSGCLYAVRRSCHQRLSGDMIDDFAIASEIHLQGLRTIYDPEALAFEHPNRQASQEFRMRVRVIEQTISAVYQYRRLLSARPDMFGFQMISHKLLRYAAPIFLVAAYASNAFLVSRGELYAFTFVGMSLFYASALLGWAAQQFRYPMGPLAIPFYFVLANIASLVALVKFVRGDSRVVWEPVREPMRPVTK